MNETFIRTAQLLGDQGFSRLSSSVVAVFGLGGVGSHCAEALARSGVGTLFFIDSDTVAPSNINRQSIALLSTVGQKKTDVMKEKIADINPECSVFTSSAFVLPENLREVFSSCPVKPDYIIDAIDTVSAKLAHAVHRNRLRRQLREIYRLHEAQFARGYDIVVVARTRAIGADYAALERAYLSLAAKLGLLGGQTA